MSQATRPRHPNAPDDDNHIRDFGSPIDWAMIGNLATPKNTSTMHDYVDNITINASRAISDSDNTNNYINNFATISTWLVAQREDALIGEVGSSAIRPMRAQNPIGLGRTSSSGAREASIADGTVAPAWSKDQG
jgi:hypothetical protein